MRHKPVMRKETGKGPHQQNIGSWAIYEQAETHLEDLKKLNPHKTEVDAER